MTTPETPKPDNASETLKAPPGECSGESPCSQFPFDALRQARTCMAEVADKCIVDAVNATDPYSKWACQERAKNIRASITEIERLELDWCNGVIFFANVPHHLPPPRGGVDGKQAVVSPDTPNSKAGGG